VAGGSNDTIGVSGSSNTSYGVYGIGPNAGIYGDGGLNGYGGFFQGDTHVNGNLSKSTGTFKIDHPLDPANRYLQHSFVESPDMKNVYDGVAILDESGEATVERPSYFETLDRDLRYQVTPVGAFSPLYVKSKLADGAFTIAGGSARQEVCWQVTGIRQDPYAAAHPIVVEQTKSAADKGKYLNPELYGQPASRATNPRPEDLVVVVAPAV